MLERFRAFRSAGRALLLWAMSEAIRSQSTPHDYSRSWPNHGYNTVAHWLFKLLSPSYRSALEGWSIYTTIRRFFVRAGFGVRRRSEGTVAESYQMLGDEANQLKWREYAARRAQKLIHNSLEKAACDKLTACATAAGASFAMAYYWQGRALEGLGCLDTAI